MDGKFCHTDHVHILFIDVYSGHSYIYWYMYVCDRYVPVATVNESGVSKSACVIYLFTTNIWFPSLGTELNLHKYLSPRAQETIWQSLAPFRIFFRVDSVQRIINRWIRAEIQLKCKKHQTSSEKSQIWRWPHTGHWQSWEKVWDQSVIGKHMDLRIPENLGV